MSSGTARLSLLIIYAAGSLQFPVEALHGRTSSRREPVLRHWYPTDTYRLQKRLLAPRLTSPSSLVKTGTFFHHSSSRYFHRGETVLSGNAKKTSSFFAAVPGLQVWFIRIVTAVFSSRSPACGMCFQSGPAHLHSAAPTGCRWFRLF